MSATPAVLLVDDHAAQRTALSAVLGDLGVEVVEAESGREALRCLLRQAFAVVLLDVNMPGLDGFETAALIRQRPASAHTPIIFVTAHADDTHRARGYSLGAVDFILAPVQSDALRAKVSVFIDLFRNAEQIRAQRAALQRYTTQLRQLSDASLAIYAAGGFDDLLHVVAENAARIIGARQASVSAAAGMNGKLTTVLLGLADAAAPFTRITRTPRRDAALSLEQPCRLQRDDSAPGYAPREVLPGQPLRGWLAAPLRSPDGEALGLVQLSDKISGDFSAEDEGILMQLARMAATTIDNRIAAEAREANRMKDEFLGVLSHELRTPLQAIFSWVDILRTQNTDEALLAQAAEVVERSAHTQMRLIDELLDVSRIARGKLLLERVLVDAAAVVARATDTVRPLAAAKQLTIDFAAPSEACMVTGDPTRLQQIAWNLISNAVKFTPEAGQVSVSLGLDGAHVTLQVRDSGPGIPADFLPHVFERFRQADSSAARAQGGLGLGLSIVHHLVELHGGQVRAGNAPEGGALMTVVLPRASLRPSAAPAPPEPEPNAERLDGIRILLVEDEADARDALCAVLQIFGAEVEAVASASAAMQAVRVREPDILVSDVGMPGEDGYALIQQVRAWEGPRDGALPAVALTAYARAEDRIAALRSGFNAHVHKPVEPMQLATLVKRLARRA